MPPGRTSADPLTARADRPSELLVARPTMSPPRPPSLLLADELYHPIDDRGRVDNGRTNPTAHTRVASVSTSCRAAGGTLWRGSVMRILRQSVRGALGALLLAAALSVQRMPAYLERPDGNAPLLFKESLALAPIRRMRALMHVGSGSGGARGGEQGHGVAMASSAAPGMGARQSSRAARNCGNAATSPACLWSEPESLHSMAGFLGLVRGARAPGTR